MRYKYFVSTSYSLESHEGRCGNNVILHDVNVFVFFIAKQNEIIFIYDQGINKFVI